MTCAVVTFDGVPSHCTVLLYTGARPRLRGALLQWRAGRDRHETHRVWVRHPVAGVGGAHPRRDCRWEMLSMHCMHVHTHPPVLCVKGNLR